MNGKERLRKNRSSTITSKALKIYFLTVGTITAELSNNNQWHSDVHRNWSSGGISWRRMQYCSIREESTGGRLKEVAQALNREESITTPFVHSRHPSTNTILNLSNFWKFCTYELFTIPKYSVSSSFFSLLVFLFCVIVLWRRAAVFVTTEGAKIVPKRSFH
ncbi:hypothetical protein AB6A40_001361 [Gnathostoma spinigerum]|uniref:Uncharacterized protein n=1 Tax=Gnathostoma spinigerum TaxID=75299 RepID=A0ABD6E633_9BILA